MTTTTPTPIQTTRDDRRAAARVVFRDEAPWVRPNAVQWIETGEEGGDGELAQVARIAEDFAVHRIAGEAAGYARRRHEEIVGLSGGADPAPTWEDRELVAWAELQTPETFACYAHWVETGDPMHCVHRPKLPRLALAACDARVVGDARGYQRGRAEGLATAGASRDLLRQLVELGRELVTAKIVDRARWGTESEFSLKVRQAHDWLTRTKQDEPRATPLQPQRYLYCVDEFEATVRYLVERNPYCKGDPEIVRKSLRGLMQSTTRRPDVFSISTAGALLRPYDHGDGHTHFKFYVDPLLTRDRSYEETEYLPAVETEARR